MISFFVFKFAHPVAASTEPPAEKKAKRSELEQKLIQGNITISEWFDSQAEGIDLFLAGQKLTKKPNKSTLQFKFSSYLDENGRVTNSQGAGFNLHLPNVEEYWNLKFTTYDEKTTRGVKKTEPVKKEIKENYGASVGIFRKLGDVRTSFEPRVELQNPVRISHSLAFESLAESGRARFNPKLEFFANPDRGTGIFHATNFNYNLNTIFGVTLVNEAEYFDREGLYEVKNGIALGQAVTERAGLSYTLMFDSNNRPNYHLSAYTISIGWSHTIYKRILDYSITPLLSFPRDKDFTGTPGLGAGLGLTF